MTTCVYVPVNDTTIDHCNVSDFYRSWIPFCRQLLVSLGMCSLYFQLGLCLGTPTVVIPRMRDENGEDYISQDMASWMYSATSYSSLPWVPVLAISASYIGRRYTFGIGVVASLVSFSMLYVGNTPLMVLGSLIAQGLVFATLIVTFFIITEYTSPQHRGVFLTLKSATISWGVWVANAIGTMAHWRYIAALGLACGLYNVMTLFIWPESPYWLASKGRLDQCKKSHWWLKGHTIKSEKELQELIKNQQHSEDEYLQENTEKTNDKKWRQVYNDMKSKYVYKSILISLVLHLHYNFSGKVVCTVYAIDIIRSITKIKSEAHKGMLILDGVTVLGMYLGCALSHEMKRRTLLFISGGISIVFLLLMSMYLYLIKLGLILETKHVTLFLLAGFSLTVGCGPMILNMSLAAELLPLRLRVTSATFLGIFAYLNLGSSIKLAPWIFTNLSFPGAFLMYGLTSGFFLLVFYMYLPETKNKTLKEIEKLIVNIGSR